MLASNPHEHCAVERQLRARLDALGPGLRRAPSTNFGSVLRRGRVNSMNRAALGLRWLATRGVSTLRGLHRR
jgi:hypothetical protein